ncbi:MAG: coenzyme F420-0:L-glutamate ligase [Myxococcales bacterium]|nr:coenzyme F420-0:L-glutamate ligase [Myxococcales bacterium]MDH3484262.1 coenzyme F420-0:L-glutamate ligase [Myxococcales bacterium]
MSPAEPGVSEVSVGAEILVRAIPGVPTVDRGDDLVTLIIASLERANVGLRDGDVLVIASKIISRAEDCFVDLSTIEPSKDAKALGAEVDKDPHLVELILRESESISRKRKGALIVRHRLGFVSANAGIDASNAAPADAPAHSGPWVLTLPRNPDATARKLHADLAARYSADVGVIVTDSWGRPFRAGTVGFAIGSSGIPPIWDRRGATDRHGRKLEATATAVADAVAAAADLVAGQADEGRPVILVRGLRFKSSAESSHALLRDQENDLYA